MVKRSVKILPIIIFSQLHAMQQIDRFTEITKSFPAAKIDNLSVSTDSGCIIAHGIPDITNIIVKTIIISIRKQRLGIKPPVINNGNLILQANINPDLLNQKGSPRIGYFIIFPHNSTIKKTFFTRYGDIVLKNLSGDITAITDNGTIEANNLNTETNELAAATNFSTHLIAPSGQISASNVQGSFFIDERCHSLTLLNCPHAEYD